MMIAQALPTGTTLGDQFARELALLLGPAYQPADGTLIAEDLRTIGDSLGDIYSTQQRSFDQAFPNSATDMLPEWETRLGVPVDPNAAIPDRQAAVTAKRRAHGGSAARVLAAVSAIYDGATLQPNTCTGVTAAPRNVFQWVVIVKDVIWADATKHARILETIEQMKAAHTRCVITTRVGFRFDDPLSLFDRDVFGT